MPIDDGKQVSSVNGANFNQYSPLKPKKEEKFGLIFDWSNYKTDDTYLKWCKFDSEKYLKSEGLDKTNVVPNISADTTILPPMFPEAKTDAIKVDKVEIPIPAIKISDSNNSKKELNLPRNYTKNFNVAKNLFKGTAEDLNACLANTKLKGQGQVFLDAQEKYGINALFLMSIAKVESGYGNKTPKGKPHNIVGAIGQNYKSYEECIDKLGNNLKKNYFSKNLTTIDKIRSKYCKTNTTWPNKISKEMERLSNIIRKRYEE